MSIKAITEISFDDDAFDKLSSGMTQQMPDEIDKIITVAFVYRDAELYSIYNLDKKTHVSPINGGSGPYVLMAYDRELNILRITEFSYK